MIRIDYDAEQLAAILGSENSPETFARIRLAFHDAGVEYSFLTQASITSPWWSFLPLAGRIGEIIDGQGDELELTAAASTEFASLRAKRNEQDRATGVPSGATADLQAFLEARGFRRKLTTKQISNVLTLLSRPGAADFSVPGAGKTTEALAWFTARSNAEDQLLVVCPKNAFLAWDGQVQDCFVDPRPLVPVRLTGSDHDILNVLNASKHRIHLVSYQRFARPEVRKMVAAWFYRNKTNAMVLDESHRIKRGQSGQWGNAVLSVAHLPSGKLILSGTPVPNSVGDLLPQYQFLVPHDKCSPETVAAKLKPLYVRTTKADLQLPPIYRRTLKVDLSTNHNRLYQLLKSEARRQLEGMSRTTLLQYRNLGKSVMKLMQAACNPALLAPELGTNQADLFGALAQEDSGKKVELVCELTRRLASKGNKVVLWSSFVQNVEMLSSRLADLGADFIHGGVNVGDEDESDTREAKIRRFHLDPSARVLVANPAAAGESISLHTVCHHAIYLDRSFNAAHYLQSEDRIYRYGLKPGQATFIFVVEAAGTIDQVISRRLAAKVAVMADILNDHSILIDRPLDLDTDSADVALDDDDIREFLAHLDTASGGND